MTKPIESMMVYVDGSEGSILAARFAVVLASRFGAELHALSVLNTRALSDLVQSHIFLESEREEYRRELADDGSRYLNHAVEMGRRKGVTVVGQSASGSVAAAIKEKVAELRIDLLVMGPPPRIRSRRDALYDEAEMAMRTVDCSVLIARDEERIEELYEELF
ncbi:MAG: universal stress protein [Spirochaetales bacterium]|nr:MAG: universal stress protein [Spirochaetales bacterium]